MSPFDGRQTAREQQRLEETRREAVEEERKRRERQLEEEHAAAQHAIRRKIRILKRVVVGLGILLVNGFWQQCSHRQSVSNHDSPIQQTPIPYSNFGPPPSSTKSAPAPEVRSTEPAPTPKVQRAEPVPTPKVRPTESAPTHKVPRAETVPTATPASPQPKLPSINDVAFISSINKILLDHDWQALRALTVNGEVNYFGHPGSTNAFIRDELTAEAREMRKINSTVDPQTFTHKVSTEYSSRWHGPMLYDSITGDAKKWQKQLATASDGQVTKEPKSLPAIESRRAQRGLIEGFATSLNDGWQFFKRLNASG
jgi:hypothetical protein